MPDIYADSFGGLTQGDLAYQAHRQQALQSAIQNFAAISQAQKQLKYHYAALEDAKKYHADQLAQSNRQLDWLMKQETPAQQRQRDFEFKAAAQDAESGLFDNPDHVAARYPNLTPPERDLMAERSATVRPQIDSSFDAADNIAQTLNKRRQLSDYIAKSEQAVKDATHFTGNDTFVDAQGKKVKIPDYEKQRIADWNDELAKLPSVNLTDKRIASLVTFDPETETYESAITQPGWRNRAPFALTKRAATAVAPGAGVPNAATPPDDLDYSDSQATPPAAPPAASASRMTREQRLALTNPVGLRRREARSMADYDAAAHGVRNPVYADIFSPATPEPGQPADYRAAAYEDLQPDLGSGRIYPMPGRQTSWDVVSGGGGATPAASAPAASRTASAPASAPAAPRQPRVAMFVDRLGHKLWISEENWDKAVQRGGIMQYVKGQESQPAPFDNPMLPVTPW